jgi:hypothetical protein
MLINAGGHSTQGRNTMKKSISIIFLFVLMAVGAYAQNVPLKEGWYQTRGSSVWVLVFQNTSWNSQRQAPMNQNGNYYIASYTEGGKQQWCVDVGSVRGNEIHTNVVWVYKSIAEEEGVSLGDFEVYTIISPTSFRNGDGLIWVWRSDPPRRTW